MKKIILTIVSSLMTIVAIAQGMVFEPETTTLEQASAKAKAENKLIFLDCFTQWCGPCKMMAKNIFPTEKVGEYMNAHFVNLKIDMETAYGSELAKKLQVQAFPTFVIFNADAQEIGRFLGASKEEEFIAKVKEKSTDNSGSALAKRWEQGDRDPQFLMTYLATLSATYRADDANDVAEAILEGKEATFAADSTQRSIFMRHINNPFAKSFVYTASHPADLSGYIGQAGVEAKIDRVLQQYTRSLIVEKDGTASLDQQKFDAFASLLKDIKIAKADHYLLSTQISLAEKQKDMDSYISLIKKYLSNPALDADDMQLARWTKPFASESVSPKQKKQMKGILLDRLKEIKAGKRQPMTRIGNMTMSRPTDQLLEMLVKTLDGEKPGQ